MLKKALIASAVLSMTSVAYANGGAIAAPHHVGAFYAGIGISRDTGHFDSRQKNLYALGARFGDGPLFAVGGDDKKKFDWSMEGWDGQIFAGYAWDFLQSNLWLGLEGFGGITNNEGEFTKTSVVAIDNAPFFQNELRFTSRAKLEQDWSAGVSLMPGYHITEDTLLFARVGWIISDFELKGRVDGHNPYVFLACPNDVACGAVARLNKSRSLNGVEAGLGLQSMITDRIGLRGEWDWAQYENFKASAHARRVVEGEGFQFVFNNQSDFKIKNPTTDSFRFSALYKFGAA